MSIEAPMISENLLQKSILRDSLFDFVQYFWDTVIPEKAIWNWHIEYICEELQKVAERVFNWQPKKDNLIINVPPGSTKSTLCSVMFPIWSWTNLVSCRCICSSYSHALSLELSRKSRNVFRSEKFQELFPMQMSKDQDAKGFFVNEYEGGRYSTSTGGTVTGHHAHFLMVDDPLNPMEAVSEVKLKRANQFMSETLASRTVDKKITPTILIMQRLHEDDPTAHMLELARKGGINVRHINLPAEITEKNEKHVRPRSLRRRYVDDPDQEGTKLLDSERMDRDVLNESQAKLGDYSYAGQFLQSPTPLEGGMIKIDRIKMESRPVMVDFIRLCRGWDKAATEGGGAYSAGVLLGEHRNGSFWVIDVIRFQLDSGERETLIQTTAKIDGLNIRIAVEQEPGSGGKESAHGTVKNLPGYIVDIVNVSGADKPTRALPFSKQANIGNVYIAEGEWNRDYINELKFFPFSKYKDQVDATSVAFTVLTTGGRIGVW